MRVATNINLSTQPCRRWRDVKFLFLRSHSEFICSVLSSMTKNKLQYILIVFSLHRIYNYFSLFSFSRCRLKIDHRCLPSMRKSLPSKRRLSWRQNHWSSSGSTATRRRRSGSALEKDSRHWTRSLSGMTGEYFIFVKNL